MQVLRVVSKRWNKFASNTVGLIKNELSIQEDNMFGEFGLPTHQLFTIAQLSFKRRQHFVLQALEHRKRYEIDFGRQDRR
jgi:hypothetical protein